MPITMCLHYPTHPSYDLSLWGKPEYLKFKAENMIFMYVLFYLYKKVFVVSTENEKHENNSQNARKMSSLFNNTQ